MAFGSLESLVQDVRYGQRMLRKNVSFSAAAVVTLALGIAASTVIFSVFDAVLLSPLAYKDADAIYRVRTVDPQGRPTGPVGQVFMDPLPESTDAIEAAAYGYSLETSVLDREGTAFAVNEYRASEQFFRVFTDPMTLGRGFDSTDDFRKTILSYQTWRDVFGSDPDIVGSVIRVNGSPLTVIGVAGKGFEFPVGTALWTRLYTSPATRSIFNFEGYLRVRPGVSAAQLQSRLDVLSTQVGPWPGGRALELVATPLLDDVVGQFRSTLLVIGGATAILLLIACLNVANLLFTRGVVRTTEIALREALGAGGTRVFRQLMTESFLLSLLGGALGLGLAWGGIRVLRAIAPRNLPRLDGVTVDSSMFLFAAACVLFTTLVVGFAPALRSSRGDLGGLIKLGRSGAGGSGRHRLFGGLVVAEIALAVMLVIGAGLLVRSYSVLTATDPGFDPEGMLTVLINVPTDKVDVRNVEVDAQNRPTRYEGTGYLSVARFYEQLVDRIEALPGVESAGVTSGAPLRAGLFPVSLSPLEIVGDPVSGNARTAYVSEVSPGFFTALGLRPVAGRLIEASDRRDTRAVAVVNQTFARSYFAGADPIGRHVKLRDANAYKLGGLAFQLGESVTDDFEIVGVIPDVKQGSLTDPVRPAIYVPIEQWTLLRMAVLVRSSLDAPAALIPAIRGALADLDRSVPGVYAVYSDVIAASLARQRLGMLLMVLFGAVSLTLSAVGIYGLVSYSASQRSNEIAVRSALGADGSRILRMFVGRGLRLAALGVALGIGGAVALRQAIATQLYGISALDPSVFSLVPLTLLGVALLASYAPARRAARTDPSAALRQG